MTPEQAQGSQPATAQSVRRYDAAAIQARGRGDLSEFLRTLPQVR